MAKNYSEHTVRSRSPSHSRPFNFSVPHLRENILFTEKKQIAEQCLELATICVFKICVYVLLLNS